MTVEELKGSGITPWYGDEMHTSLYANEVEPFRNWFFENCVHYNEHINYNDYKNISDPLLGSGCYGNGQYLALTEGFPYAEGIVAPEGTYTNEFIPHGFNVIDGKIADFSFKKITTETPQYLSKMPSDYYGIIIPREFILQQQGEGKTPLQLHKPLLLDYWREITGN